MDTRTSPHALRVTQLRELLVREGIHALLVPCLLYTSRCV